MKKFGRILFRWLFIACMICIAMWTTYFFVVQKNAELQKNISAIADNLTKKMVQVIEASDKKEAILIESEIRDVSKKIFAEREVYVEYLEQSSFSSKRCITNFKIHGVVSEDFWSRCISVSPKNGIIQITYGADDLQIIAEIVNQEEYCSTLYVAKQYLSGIVKDASRLTQMALNGEYIPPQFEEPYWIENLDLLKKYEWSDFSVSFQNSIINVFPKYKVVFSITSPELTESEQSTIESWTIK